jgi:mRNA interferase RelE/StbE
MMKILVKYKIEYSKHCAKDLEKVPKVFRKAINKKIDELSSNPRPNGCKKLQGSDKNAFYRVRCGDWRIVYAINDDILLVFVVEVGQRKAIYRSF